MSANLLAVLPVAFAIALYLAINVAFVGAVWVARFRARASRPGRRLAPAAPFVSILKPLAGLDDDLDANLDSFADIQYPAFEVLFGAASPSDPALQAARRFLARHPSVPAKIVLTNADAALNPKAAQLISLGAQARGQILVISDSNVRVRSDYLDALVGELEAPGVGLVTSIFAGTGEKTLGAALENLQLGAVVTPGIVAYNLVSPSPLTLGKSMAIRASDLARFGGFARVGGVLAEDYELGRLVLRAGLEVRTSLSPVENRNVDASVWRTVERHSRWAKMRRAISPLPFVFEPLMSPVAVATVMLPFGHAREQVLALALAVVVQVVVGFSALRVLRGNTLAWYYAPLEVFRTWIALGCWALAFVSRRVEWRGHAFLIGAGSVLHHAPVAPAQDASPGSLRAASRSLLRIATLGLLAFVLAIVGCVDAPPAVLVSHMEATVARRLNPANPRIAVAFSDRGPAIQPPLP